MDGGGPLGGNSIKKRTAVIIGAGRIGRGFLAEIFHKIGCDIVFVDNDSQLVDKLMSSENYTIFKAMRDRTDTYTLSGFAAYHTSQHAEICGALSRQDAICCIAVPADSLSDVAGTLALPVAWRAMQSEVCALDVLICVNTPSPAAHMRAHMEALLGGAALDYMRGNVGFVDTIVMTIAPEIPEAVTAVDPLGVCTNGYPSMSVDASAIKGGLPDSPMIIHCENMYAEETRKIYTANMAHAALAYIGAAKGYVSAIEAISDAEVRGRVRGALCESTVGLCHTFGFGKREMELWCDDIIVTLDNPLLADNLARLGGDSARKLAAGDRLAGAANMCLRAGEMPINIIDAIAHGYLFTLSDDAGTLKTQEMVRREGIITAIEILSGFDMKHPLQGAVLEAYYTAKDRLEALRQKY